MTSLWALKQICLKLFQVLCIVKHIDVLNKKTNKQMKKKTQTTKIPHEKPKDITPELKISYARFKSRVWPSDASLKIEAYIMEMQMC